MRDELVIYSFPELSTFIKKDIEILSEKYILKQETRNWKNKKLILWNFIAQSFFYLRHVKKTNAFVIMFAGYWSVVPVFIGKLFQKKTYIILGGTDCVSFPEFNYGSLRKKTLRRAIAYSVKNCHLLLPVAKELMYQNYTYYPSKNKEQGLKAFFPNLQTSFKEIPNGYDLSNLDTGNERKPNSFVSIAKVDDETRYQLKGLDLILEAAKIFPKYRFIIIGVDSVKIRSLFNGLANVEVFQFLNQNEIQKILLKSQFYLQLSISEGHPNALCEAMLAGCVPIGSDVSSIPRIIGSSGFILRNRNQDELKALLENICHLSSELIMELSKKSQLRISENFSLSQRKKMLESIIDNN